MWVLQGTQTLSVSTTPSKCGSTGSQSMLSSNSCTREAIYTTVGLYQVQIIMLKNNALYVKPKYFNYHIIFAHGAGERGGHKVFEKSNLYWYQETIDHRRVQHGKNPDIFRDSVLPQQVTGQFFANTLMLVFVPAVAERNETREPSTVLRCVYRATKCLYRHAVLQERKLEGEYTVHCRKYCK